MGNSTVLDHIQSELLPISPDGAQTPLKYLLGTIISHLICPDGGKGSSGQITVQVWLGFPLSKPQLKQAYGQCEHGRKPCGWLTFWDSGRVMEMASACSKRIWSKSQMRNVSSVKMFSTSSVLASALFGVWFLLSPYTFSLYSSAFSLKSTKVSTFIDLQGDQTLSNLLAFKTGNSKDMRTLHIIRRTLKRRLKLAHMSSAHL